MSEVILLENISKFYGEILGVNKVSLSIPPGVNSLVGPNGSGKTTLMNLIAGLLRPTRGRIVVCGLAANSEYNSPTTVSNSAFLVNRETKPTRCASAASRRRPVIIRSSTTLGAREFNKGIVITNGHKPTLISGTPNTAVSSATTKSHAAAKPMPPANA